MRNNVILVTIACLVFMASVNLFAQDAENVELVGRINYWIGAFDIVVDSNLAYVATGSSGLQIVDVTDPENPEVTGYWDGDGVSSLTKSGNYVYVLAGSYQDESMLFVLDVSNPENPDLVGELDIPGYTVEIDVNGDYVYVAAREAGLRIIDISDSENPDEDAFLDN